MTPEFRKNVIPSIDPFPSQEWELPTAAQSKSKWESLVQRTPLHGITLDQTITDNNNQIYLL